MIYNNKGFVTYTNDNPKYVALTKCLVDSILHFTDLPVEVCSINFDYKHDNKRVISKKINLNNEKDLGSVYYAKLLACIESEFDQTMHIDSDAIITPEVIRMFDVDMAEKDLVYMPLHPWNGPVYPRVRSVMNDMGLREKTQPYLHAASFLFTKYSKHFLREVWDYSQKISSFGFAPENYDESLLNCFLWKYQKTNCYVDCYDPYFEYFKMLKNMPSKSTPTYSDTPNFVVNPYICHGCKDPNHQSDILLSLKKLY